MFHKIILSLIVSLGLQSSYSLEIADEFGSSSSDPIPCLQPAIIFNTPLNPYYEFTNNYRAPFLETNVSKETYTWWTNEHYFQAQKFNYPGTFDIFNQINVAKTPQEAFELVKNYQSKIRPDWQEKIKDSPMGESWTREIQAMYTGLQMKFTSHLELAALLMSTDGCQLIDNTDKAGDFWGIGTDGKGKNMLGKLLLKLREEFFQNPSKVHGKGPLFISFNLPTIRELSGVRLEYYKYVLTQLQMGKSVCRYSQFSSSL